MIYARVRNRYLWRNFSFQRVYEVDFFGGLDAINARNDLCSILKLSDSALYRNRVKFDRVLEKHLYDFFAVRGFQPCPGRKNLWQFEDSVVNHVTVSGGTPLVELEDNEELRELKKSTEAARLRAERSKYESTGAGYDINKKVVEQTVHQKPEEDSENFKFQTKAPTKESF